jgi:hypothetical protein
VSDEAFLTEGDVRAIAIKEDRMFVNEDKFGDHILNFWREVAKSKACSSHGWLLLVDDQIGEV